MVICDSHNRRSADATFSPLGRRAEAEPMEDRP
jgi:hypothetical protein